METRWQLGTWVTARQFVGFGCLPGQELLGHRLAMGTKLPQLSCASHRMLFPPRFLSVFLSTVGYGPLPILPWPVSQALACPASG